MKKLIPTSKRRTPMFEAALEEADGVAQSAGHSFVSHHHLFIALLGEKHDGLDKLLSVIGVKSRRKAYRLAVKELKRKATIEEMCKGVSLAIELMRLP